MTDLLVDIHPWIGYLVAAVMLVIAFVAFGRAKEAREFTPGSYVLAMVLLDIQVTLGLLLYVLDGRWEDRPELAYLHPALALLALAIGHARVGRARRVQMAVDAHRMAGRGLLMALVVVAAAIGVASAPAFM